MKSIQYCFIFLLLIFFQVPSAKCQPTKFKRLIESCLLSFPANAEIAIGIIDRDSIYKFGYRAVNGNLMAVNNQLTLFQIGSITKVFTAALLMREVERNTMALNDPVQKHLTFKIKQDSFRNHTITMLHLVTHTSGLKKEPLMSYERYTNYLKKFELDYIPGQRWDYNNLAVDLMGELIAEKNQSTWEILVRENLLKPLSMNNTYINPDEVPKNNRVQCIYEKGTGDCFFLNLKLFQWASGSIVSTVDDMLKWVQANVDREKLNPDLYFIHRAHDPLADTISIPWFQKYKATQGIGWMHHRTNPTNRFICHGGNMPKQTSFIGFDKVNKRGVIILANIDGHTLMNDDKIMKTTDLAIRLLEL